MTFRFFKGRSGCRSYFLCCPCGADRRPLPARFLILGSVSPWLMKGVTESLAGRVSFVDVAGLGLGEVGAEQHRRLWWRGGFPVPYLAETDEWLRQWQDDMERTVIERDFAQFGVSESPAVVRESGQAPGEGAEGLHPRFREVARAAAWI